MNYYFTFNDSYSGVYQSQVIDVVKLYKNLGIKIRLIALLSARNYLKDRKAIKKQLPDSIVYPAFPKLKNWEKNKILLDLLTKRESQIICRGVFATNLALFLRKKFNKIIYDGRGAVKAEQKEYGVYSGTGVESQIAELEHKAVLQSDFRIAVTRKLVNWWGTEYGYIRGKEVVIPCTVSNNFLKKRNEQEIDELRIGLGINKTDIVIVYAGSLAGWQSLSQLKVVVEKALGQNREVKVLFLSGEHQIIEDLILANPDRVFQRFVSPQEVVSYLDLADFGLLLREKSITNKVASPVKCAEYLSRGLKVLISPEIGDYSEWICDNSLGYVIEKGTRLPNLKKENRESYVQFAIDNLSKQSEGVSKRYQNLMTK